MKDAMKYIDKFPKILEEQWLEAWILLKHFILYDHQGNAHCTACGADFSVYSKVMRHRDEVGFVCPECGRRLTTIDITNNFSGTVQETMRNVVFYLAGDDGNLYVRCYTIGFGFMHGRLDPVEYVTEMQRYVFTPGASARFGVKWEWKMPSYNHYIRDYKNKPWKQMSKFSEPKFGNIYSYSEIGVDAAVRKAWLKHAFGDLDFPVFESYLTHHSILSYLRFFCRHQGIERLIKCGFCYCLNEIISNAEEIINNLKLVDWNQNEPHRMLGVTKPAMHYLAENRVEIKLVRQAQVYLPDIPLERAIDLLQNVGSNYHLKDIPDIVGAKNTSKVIKYIVKQKSDIQTYWDYISNCKQLKDDINSKEIMFPPHLQAAHDRAYAAIEAKKIKEDKKKKHELNKKRKKLEYEEGNLVVIQPRNAEEIICEGQTLRHCVGGYVSRHVKGETNIMFIRHKDNPEVPYFTIEIDNSYKIVQCHGYRNECETNGKKPEEIETLEKHYKEYLQKQKKKKMPNRQKVRVSA